MLASVRFAFPLSLICMIRRIIYALVSYQRTLLRTSRSSVCALAFSQIFEDLVSENLSTSVKTFLLGFFSKTLSPNKLVFVLAGSVELMIEKIVLIIIRAFMPFKKDNLT